MKRQSYVFWWFGFHVVRNKNGNNFLILCSKVHFDCFMSPRYCCIIVDLIHEMSKYKIISKKNLTYKPTNLHALITY